MKIPSKSRWRLLIESLKSDDWSAVLRSFIFQDKDTPEFRKFMATNIGNLKEADIQVSNQISSIDTSI